MNRRRLFEVSWRAAIITLPWQTRWFHDATLAGWPWEQGRWSVYASWFLIFVAVVSGWPYLKSLLVGQRARRLSYLFGGLFACSMVATLFNSFDQAARFVAVSQWWVEVMLLLFFGLTLAGAKVGWRAVTAWFVVSLIPEAFLGCAQFAAQVVVGSKWLGVAPHLAQTPGTAVVEFGLWRYLRAYGGFPHPNIFGGWLAVGVLATLLLAGTTESKKQASVSFVLSALFAVALVLTFSRGAWIACVVGFVMLLVVARKEIFSKQYFWLAVASAVIAGGAVGISQRAVVLARSDTSSRLEAKSIDVRSQSLKDGLALVWSHPFFGTGPNAELIDLAESQVETGYTLLTYKTTAPLEPPHDIFLIALADFGIVGAALLCVLVSWIAKRIPRRAWPFVVCLIVIGLVDHYPWSTWSGLCLILIMCLFCLSDEPKLTA